MSYNFSISNISYSDDEEYRKTICDLFDITYEPDVDIEFERFMPALDLIYFKTKDQPLFQVVYNQAASFMLSENQEIGLSVLFAYDNLPLFHEMLVAFNTLGDRFDDNHPSYANLYKKLFS